MTRIAISFLLFALTVIGASGNIYAATTKDEHELQERCNKHAKEIFKREFGNGIIDTEERQAKAEYSNHYNKKLNKCFYLLTYSESPNKVDEKNGSTFITLIDIKEREEYGRFSWSAKYNKPIVCEILEIKCHSKSEWETLIKPYMEE